MDCWKQNRLKNPISKPQIWNGNDNSRMANSSWKWILSTQPPKTFLSFN